MRKMTYENWEKNFVEKNKEILLKIAQKLEKMKKKEPKKYKEIMEIVY